MTPEPPPNASRHARPGRNARRRALGLEVPPPLPVRESLRDSLARIPDLTDEDLAVIGGGGVAVLAPAAPADPEAPAGPAGPEAGPATTADPDVDAESPAAPAVAGGPPRVLDDSEVTADPSAPASLAGDGDAPETIAPAVSPARHGRIAPPPKAPMWRRISFAVLLIALVAAIPILGRAGAEIIRDSTDGSFDKTLLSPEDPGFEAQVDPTPTAVAIQYDDTGMPNGVTFMALGGADGGGTVVFVPLDTEVTEPSFGVDRLRTAYKVVADRPPLARERLASQVGRLLNVGVDEIIDLGDEGWAQLVAPVAPLQIDNPDELTLADGTVIPAGPTTLTAEQAGQYLAAQKPGESDLNRLNRHEVVWSAWLEQVAASGRDDAVPGESSAGIARFAQALSKGPVEYRTLPVLPSKTAPGRFTVDKSAVGELVTDNIASPTAAVPGSRFTVRLLNGVSPNAVPSDIVRQVVSRGGAVTILGNGPAFDTDKTEVVYANPAMADVAELMATSLGATGNVRLDREAPDTVDLTIVLGRDILGDDDGTGDPGATTPETAGN